MKDYIWIQFPTSALPENRRGDRETPCGWFHQESLPPRVVGKSHSCVEEEREMEDVCQLHES